MHSQIKKQNLDKLHVIPETALILVSVAMVWIAVATALGIGRSFNSADFFLTCVAGTILYGLSRLCSLIPLFRWIPAKIKFFVFAIPSAFYIWFFVAVTAAC